MAAWGEPAPSGQAARRVFATARLADGRRCALVLGPALAAIYVTAENEARARAVLAGATPSRQGHDGTAEPGLSPLIDKVDCAGLIRFTGSLEQLLTEYVGTMVEAHGAALARVWTSNSEDGSLHLVASAGLSRAVATRARSVIRLSSYSFKVGFVARTGIPYVHTGREGDRDFDRAWIKREHLESAAVLPLVADGRLVGVIAQLFRCRLEVADVGRLQASAALCEAWLGSLHRRRAAPVAS